MTVEPPAKRKCIGVDCKEDAGTLQCPTCLKLGLKESYFCSQDCFKRSWTQHKSVHKPQNGSSNSTDGISNSQKELISQILKANADGVSKPDPITGTFNPFPKFPFTGPLRPVYPLSERRTVPASIRHPDYAVDGNPKSERVFANRNKIEILDKKQQEGMRKVCRLAREVLDIAARAVKPGVTTDYIDEIVHNACLERDSYPSPLNYCGFPKSVCTSVNEIICHGIPDKRELVDGDIVNIDVTLYHGGFHGDLNETYYVGDKAKADPDSVRVVEAARECLEKCIPTVKPGALFRDYGNIIEKHAKSQNCGVVRTYCGHGINSLFHCAPNVPHYGKNKAVGEAKEGMCFTIEPMITLGSYRDKSWPDDWTAATMDGKRTAQFEHTFLVTADGVEVLTARLPDSPGGPIHIPVITSEKIVNGS